MLASYRCRRELDPMTSRKDSHERYRSVLVDAALDLMLTDAINALRGLLSVSAVHKRAAALGRVVPRASAYRAFSGQSPTSHTRATDELIRAVAAEATTFDRSGAAASQRATLEAFATQLSAAEDEPVSQDQSEEHLIRALQVNLDTTLTNDGLPITWLLGVVAMTASPAWKGTKRPSPVNAELAGDILANFQRYTEERTVELTALMRTAMSAARRRPRPGMTPETLIKLMNAMFHGTVMRLIIEPDAFDTRLAAEAIYRIGLSFSEPGAYWDPRRPQDQHAETFDKLVDEARTRYREDNDVTVDDVARSCGVDPSVAAQLFPTGVDLADSVVRCLVMSGGPADTTSRVDATQLAGMLWRLADSADTYPAAVTIAHAQRHHLTTSIIAELLSLATQFADATLPTDRTPTAAAGTANSLINFALEGKETWPATLAILRILGLPASEAQDR